MSTAKKHHQKRLMLALFWAPEDVNRHPKAQKDHIPNPLQGRSFQNLIVLEVVSFYEWWKIACCNNSIYVVFWIYLHCSVLKGSRVQNFQDLSSCCISIGFKTEKNCQMLTNAMDAISWHCYTPPKDNGTCTLLISQRESPMPGGLFSGFPC